MSTSGGSVSDALRRPVGRCEVVCFDPATTGSLGELPLNRMRTVIEAWADRTAVLSALPGVAQVFPFENRGEAIGVTLHHPHGQIYAYPYVTPRTQRLLASVDAVPDLFATILEFERGSERVVLAGEHWTAFVPFAARWPVEVHLLPHRHIPDLAATNEAEREELATMYRTLLRGIDRLYDTPTPYIAAWHQAPVREGRDDIRLMLQLTSPRRGADRLKYQAGSEAAMGAWIGDIVPEAAAELFRDALGRIDERHQGRGGRGAARRVRRRAGRDLVGTRTGEPHRRAHRLQRRVRAAVCDQPTNRRRAAAHREPRHPGREFARG